jgi:hypothetical protein
MDAETTSQNEPEKSEVDSTLLSSRALYQHDPLLVLLKDKLHLSTPWIVAGGFIFGGLSSFIFIPVFLRDFQPTVSLGYVFVRLLVAIAIIFNLLIYLLLPASMASVFNTLRANGVIGPPRQERLGAMSYARFLQQVVTWVDSRWWSTVMVMLSPLYFLYAIFIFTPQSLTVPPVWLLVSYVIGPLPFLYTLGFVFLRVMLLLIFLNRFLFLFNIRVRPLHPDGSGGLAALSRIWWMVAALIFVTALSLVPLIGQHPGHLLLLETISTTIGYLILLPAIAIGWFALPHHVMVQARNEHLQPLAEEYERVLMETRPTADEATAQIVAGTERLSALKQRYELVRDTFPTWPLQVVEMRRLAVALLLPALIALLPALFDVFTKK